MQYAELCGGSGGIVGIGGQRGKIPQRTENSDADCGIDQYDQPRKGSGGARVCATDVRVQQPHGDYLCRARQVTDRSANDRGGADSRRGRKIPRAHRGNQRNTEDHQAYHRERADQQSRARQRAKSVQRCCQCGNDEGDRQQHHGKTAAHHFFGKIVKLDHVQAQNKQTEQHVRDTDTATKAARARVSAAEQTVRTTADYQRRQQQHKYQHAVQQDRQQAIGNIQTAHRLGREQQRLR